VPFRDINNLLPYINRIWLYMTPIIWPLSLLDDVNPFFQSLVRLNPMFDFVSLYRSALLGNPLILDHVVGAMVWAAVVGIVGVALFVRHEGHMVRYL
jgi:ABC-2 type transport system permease protein